jgi:hypothetical protein
MIANDARCKREMISRIVMTKAAINEKKAPFTSTFGLNVKNKMAKCYIWSTALCGTETRTLRKVDQK